MLCQCREKARDLGHFILVILVSFMSKNMKEKERERKRRVEMDFNQKRITDC